MTPLEVEGGSLPLLTSKDVRGLLESHSLAPRKSSGQNFVVDPNTVRKIVRDAGISPDDTVLEIGPGLGSLTRALVAAARRVVAVEVDAGFVRVLRETLSDVDNVEIIHADALGADLADFAPPGVRLVANLPYNLATPLAFHALESSVVGEQYVMVQREVGQRWAAGVGDDLYGAVSVKLQLVVEVAVEQAVPRGVFYPVPNVDSVMVRLSPRSDALPAEEWRAVRRLVDAAFAQRRKALRNTLRALGPQPLVDAALAASGIDPSTRAEALEPVQFVALARSLDTGTAPRTHTMGSEGAT